MENLGQVPKSSGALSTFSNSNTTLFGSEEVKFPFRLNVPISANVNPADGFLAFGIPIDAELQSNFFTAFEYFTFENLAFDMQCTAPLGTASGAIQVAFFSDPLNATVPDSLADAKAKLGSTDGWVMIRPRDSKTLQIPVDLNPTMNNWRYVRSDPNNIRLSSFGTVVGITAEPPAAGDGTVYEGWLHGWAVGRRRTENVGTNAIYERYLGEWMPNFFEWSYENDCPYLDFRTTAAFSSASKYATFLFDRVISFRVEVGYDDAGGAHHTKRFEIDFSAATGYIEAGTTQAHIRMYFPDMADAGVYHSDLVSDIGLLIADQASKIPCTIQYTNHNIKNMQAFNNARFRAAKPHTTRWLRPSINPGRPARADASAACTISGRRLSPIDEVKMVPSNRIPRQSDQ